MNELLVNYFNAQESEVIELFKQAEILAKKAAEVVLRFMRRYQAEKKRRHVLEFSDLEHLTLKDLTSTRRYKCQRTLASALPRDHG